MGRSIQSASSSSAFDAVAVAVTALELAGRESAERDRHASLLRVEGDVTGDALGG